MSTSKKIKSIAFTALFAAMFCVLTAVLKIPTDAGYVHLGDTALYLCACLLPTPYAAVAGAVGGGLADLIGGYPHYIIPTVIIKALVTLPFTSKKRRIMTARNYAAPFISFVISVFGYYFTKVVLLSLSSDLKLFSALLSPVYWSGALYKIPENAFQSGVSAVLFIIIALILDRAQIKDRFLKIYN